MPSSPRPAHRPSRRPQILDAALAEIGAEGAAGGFPAMAAIAERAGVTPAAMYYHFDSRDDLLVALVERVTPEVVGLLDEEPDAAGERLTDLMDRFSRWVRAEPAAARFYFVTVPGVAAPMVRAAYAASQRQLEARVESWLQEAGKGGDAVETWLRAAGLASLFQEMVFLGLEQHDRPTRGFHAIERAGRQIATALLV